MPSPRVVPLSKKSTNGRLLQPLLRAYFRALSRFAPHVSDRRAAALFLTPRRRRQPAPGTPGLGAERVCCGTRNASCLATLSARTSAASSSRQRGPESCAPYAASLATARGRSRHIGGNQVGEPLAQLV